MVGNEADSSRAAVVLDIATSASAAAAEDTALEALCFQRLRKEQNADADANEKCERERESAKSCSREENRSDGARLYMT